MNVSQILKTKGQRVITATTETTIRAVMDVLAHEGIGAIIIADDGGHVDGIISERDIVRGLAERGETVLDGPARDLMTKRVITCGLEDKIDELMQQMTENRIRHLPVIDNLALVGVISIGDVVKFRVDELENETTMLRDYIEHS
ncbi:MAG: CBS domain-containing protein [Proteobacteria bacterium]|nr:CBS domain-containing protein [Pseudomonadota bacterium]